MCCNGVLEMPEFKRVVNQDSWFQRSCRSLVNHKYVAINNFPFFFHRTKSGSFFVFGIGTIDFLRNISNLKSRKRRMRGKSNWRNLRITISYNMFSRIN